MKEMGNDELFTYIDHTLLKTGIVWSEVEQVGHEAAIYHAACVVIPPCYVSRMHQMYPGVPVATVVGFPLGCSTPGAKVFEAQQAVESGANEIEMVVNNSDIKSDRLHRVMAEITAVKNVIGDHLLKVIIETYYLTDKEKVEVAKVVEASGAEYIKTCSGFAPGGVTVADVELLRKSVSDRVKIKAAGGISSKQEMLDLLNAGASRLGSSNGVNILFRNQRPQPITHL